MFKWYAQKKITAARTNHADFLTQPDMQHRQDGASETQDPAFTTEDMDSTEPTSAPYQGSPTDRGKLAAQSPVLSPNKAPLYKKQHWDAPDRSIHGKEDLEHLAVHPASDQPASEQALKLMLLSPQKDLRNELRLSLFSVHTRLEHVEEHTDMLERQMTEYAFAPPEAFYHHSEEIRLLQAKVADLENCSRKNNIKFRGIPKTVKPQDLIHYIQQLFFKLNPQLSQADIAIDRAHRIVKPNYLPESVPRDVLRIHVFFN